MSTINTLLSSILVDLDVSNPQTSMRACRLDKLTQFVTLQRKIVSQTNVTNATGPALSAKSPQSGRTGGCEVRDQVITIKPFARFAGAGGEAEGSTMGVRNAFGGEEAELPSSTTDAVPGEKVDGSTKEGFTDDVGSESEDEVGRRLELQVS